jgi:hypothetical protein
LHTCYRKKGFPGQFGKLHLGWGRENRNLFYSVFTVNVFFKNCIGYQPWRGRQLGEKRQPFW